MGRLRRMPARGQRTSAARLPRPMGRASACLGMPRKSSTRSLPRLTPLRLPGTPRKSSPPLRPQLTPLPQLRMLGLQSSRAMRKRHFSRLRVQPRSRNHARLLSRRRRRSRLAETASRGDTEGTDSGQVSTRAWPTWQRHAERSRPWPIFTARLPSNRRVPPPRRPNTGSGFTSRTSRPSRRDRPRLRCQRPRSSWTKAS